MIRNVSIKLFTALFKEYDKLFDTIYAVTDQYHARNLVKNLKIENIARIKDKIKYICCEGKCMSMMLNVQGSKNPNFYIFIGWCSGIGFIIHQITKEEFEEGNLQKLYKDYFI